MGGAGARPPGDKTADVAALVGRDDVALLVGRVIKQWLSFEEVDGYPGAIKLALLLPLEPRFHSRLFRHVFHNVQYDSVIGCGVRFLSKIMFELPETAHAQLIDVGDFGKARDATTQNAVVQGITRLVR